MASVKRLSDMCAFVHNGRIVAGTGRTGFYDIPPNNYQFYSDQEKYTPVIQADGGQLSGGMQTELIASVSNKHRVIDL